MTATIGSMTRLGQTNAVQSNELDFTTISLTPDTIIAFCQSKLRDLDRQVTSAMNKQQTRNRDGHALAELQQTLNVHANKIDGNDDAGKEDVIAAYKKAIDAVGPNSDLGQKLQVQLDSFDSTAHMEGKTDGGGADVDHDEMTKFANAVDGLQSDLNRDSELDMLQLQSTVSQRQQALQLCTNLVSTMNQSAMSVVQNVGK